MEIKKTNIVCNFFAVLALLTANNTYALNPDRQASLQNISNTQQASYPAINLSTTSHTLPDFSNIKKSPQEHLQKKTWTNSHTKQYIYAQVNTAIERETKAISATQNTNHQAPHDFLITNTTHPPPPTGDQSLAMGDHDDVNWVEKIFPSMDNCTPGSFYFDLKARRSNNGIPEKYGYHAYKIDEYTATYKVRGRFFGLNAIEISIPSNTDSIYTVTVLASGKSLADAIKSTTTHSLPLYSKKFKAQSAKAYIVPEGENKSTLVCFTFNGGF